ncbi:MAG: hypothetical protein P4L41_15505 [Flavipsychrobacter sp.]|nr:hypothetical protein [Flavipsychrobacter sp.]
MIVYVSIYTLPRHMITKVAIQLKTLKVARKISVSATRCQKSIAKVIINVPTMPEAQLPTIETIMDFFQEYFRKYLITKVSMTIVPIIKNQKCQKVSLTNIAGQTISSKTGFI